MNRNTGIAATALAMIAAAGVALAPNSYWLILLGLAGTPDLKLVTDRASAGDETAQLAVEVYVHHLVAAVAAMTPERKP